MLLNCDVFLAVLGKNTKIFEILEKKHGNNNEVKEKKFVVHELEPKKIGISLWRVDQRGPKGRLNENEF